MLGLTYNKVVPHLHPLEAAKGIVFAYFYKRLGNFRFDQYGKRCQNLPKTAPGKDHTPPYDV